MTVETREPTPEAAARIAQVMDEYRDHVNPGLARLMQFAGFADVEATASGTTLTTVADVKYLDFVGGYGVFSLGHCHPAVIAAVRRQLDLLPLSTRTFFNSGPAGLATRLASLAPGDLEYAFFCNSGAEAVEAALKFARCATGRPGFVSSIDSFHGKTFGALSVTGREKYRKPFEPLIPGVSFVPYNDADAARAAITEQTAAMIVEVVQGEGGIHVAAPGYLRALREACDRVGALLIVDEVQTGMARTGPLFAVEAEGVVPDIMPLAKALGGGVMPIGATLATPWVWERVFAENPLIHTSTFGGNPLACAAAMATLDVIEQEGLGAAAVERGEQLLTGLRAIQRDIPGALVEARGRGLMIGVEFAVKDVAEIAINGMARRGVIAAYTLNNPKVIRMEPPLNVSAQEIDHALAAFRESTEEAVAMLDGIDE